MKRVIGFLSGLGLSLSLFAADFTFRAVPGMFFPINKDYETGFNAFVQADMDMLGFLTFGAEGNFALAGTEALKKPAQVLGGGLGLGAYYYPFSRLYTGIGGSAGVYQLGTNFTGEKQSALGWYYRGYGELGYRFNPEFTISATGGYVSYQVVNDKPFIEGITAGISLRYTVPLGKTGTSSFGVSLEQEDSVQPLFMTSYRTCPLGILTLTNNEGAEVKNVHVSFRAGKYTSSTFESAELNRINKYASVKIPLYADFSPEILKFSENGKIPGELIVEYEFLGKKKQAVQNVVLSVYNRNAFYWADPNALVAFVSPNTPEILSFAKYVAGIVNKLAYTGMNKSIQTAAGMVEGLRLSGIVYSGDKKTPYETYHLRNGIDNIQYPLQTMNCLSGDYDDLGILLASCLESVGVATGFLPVDDDFIVLVDLGVAAKSAKLHVADINSLLAYDGKVWFGLSMKELENGFSDSFEAGSEAIADMLDDEDGLYDIVVTEKSWETYAPAVFSTNGNDFENPKTSVLEEGIKDAINEYIESDLEPIMAKSKAEGNYHQLGLALVRAGRYSEAKEEFSKLDTLSAMNNLAHIYLLEHDFNACAAQYRKVLQKDPENKSALKGLERVNEKLGL